MSDVTQACREEAGAPGRGRSPGLRHAGTRRPLLRPGTRRPGRPRLSIAAVLLALPSTGAFSRGQEERGPVRLDFETYPDGSPACDRCPVDRQFETLGVLFSFHSPRTTEERAHLIASGAYDPPGEEENHSVTAALTEEGFFPGILVLTFPAAPRRVSFRLRGPAAVRAFSVRAWGPGGSPVPPAHIVREGTTTYGAARGGLFREEVVTVEAPRGLARLELDGRGPPGHILLVDELSLRWPDAGRGPGPEAATTPRRPP